MIMKHIVKIFVVLVALTACVGCFKKEKQGTQMRIELSSQNVESDPVTKTTCNIEGYAFYVKKNTKWEVKSWEDALNKRISNVDKPGEVLTEPQVIATYDPEAEYQLTFELWSHYTFMVIVDHTNRLYATRLYETPMNLPVVFAHLHLYAWSKSGQKNGWDFTNPFPDEPREPLVPVEDDTTTEETFDTERQ